MYEVSRFKWLKTSQFSCFEHIWILVIENKLLNHHNEHYTAITVLLFISKITSYDEFYWSLISLCTTEMEAIPNVEILMRNTQPVYTPTYSMHNDTIHLQYTRNYRD